MAYDDMPPSQLPRVATVSVTTGSKPMHSMADSSASELNGTTVAAKKLAAKSVAYPAVSNMLRGAQFWLASSAVAISTARPKTLSIWWMMG